MYLLDTLFFPLSPRTPCIYDSSPKSEHTFLILCKFLFFSLTSGPKGLVLTVLLSVGSNALASSPIQGLTVPHSHLQQIALKTDPGDPDDQLLLLQRCLWLALASQKATLGCHSMAWFEREHQGASLTVLSSKWAFESSLHCFPILSVETLKYE